MRDALPETSERRDWNFADDGEYVIFTETREAKDFAARVVAGGDAQQLKALAAEKDEAFVSAWIGFRCEGYGNLQRALVASVTPAPATTKKAPSKKKVTEAAEPVEAKEEVDDGKPITEIPMGDENGRALKKSPYNDTKINRILHYMNEEFAALRMGADYRVLQDNGPENPPTFLRFETFKALYKTCFVFVEERTPAGKKKIVKREFVDLWWAWGERRTFVDGITFAPPKNVEGPEKKQSHVFNTWRGIVKPEPGSVKDWPLLRSHMLENVCQGDRANFDWLKAWFAQHYQQPGIKLGSAVVVKGKKGTGKSVLFDNFRAGLGRYAMKVSNRRHITGNFNAHQQGIIHMTCEEGFWAGDKQAAGSLKDLITSPTMNLELKGIDPVEVPNFVRLAFVSNERWVVPADLEGEERRFFVLECGDKHRQDIDYFARLSEEMSNGGLAAMVADLSSYVPAKGWTVLRTPPQTPWLAEQGRQSIDDDVRFFTRLIELGKLETQDNPFIPEIVLDALENEEGTAVRVPYAILLRQFEHYMLRHGDRRNVKDQFKNLATRLLGADPVLKSAKVTLQIPERDRDDGMRHTKTESVKCFICPPLKVIRATAVERGYLTADKFEPDELPPAPAAVVAAAKLQRPRRF